MGTPLRAIKRWPPPAGRLRRSTGLRVFLTLEADSDRLLGVCRIGRTEEAKECWSGLRSDYRLHESMLSQIVGLGYPLPPT